MQQGIYRQRENHANEITVLRVLKTQVEFKISDRYRPVTMKIAAFEAEYEPKPANVVLGWDNLIDENAEVKVWVMKAMARRYALGQYGAVTPLSLRTGLRWVNDRIPMLIERKRRELGLPVEAGVVVSGLVIADGFGREA